MKDRKWVFYFQKCFYFFGWYTKYIESIILLGCKSKEQNKQKPKQKKKIWKNTRRIYPNLNGDNDDYNDDDDDDDGDNFT